MPRPVPAFICGVLVATIATAVPATAQRATVTVDSARREVTIRVGPFTVDTAAHEHGQESHGPEAAPLTWPVDGWVRKATLRYLGPDGTELPRSVGQHVNLINYSRRQLFYPAFERLAAWGPETGTIELPGGVGVPVRAATPMGMIVRWHNGSGRIIEGMTAEVVVTWTPANQNPRPLDVLAVYTDVTYPVARSVAFDLPGGPSVWSATFTLPLDGRILAAGAHLHDFGEDVRLIEVRRNDEQPLFTLKARRDSSGRVLAMERRIPGVSGDGMRVRTGARYRIEARYDNRSGGTLPGGGMAHLVLLFVPDRLADWPTVDAGDAELARDAAHLGIATRAVRGGHTH